MEKQHPIPFCPGIHDMAEMKDGLLARLRLPGGQLSANKAQLIADLAAKFGSGEIDLTNRANLQLRGITEATKTPLLEHLLVYDLVSKDPVHDRLRNITIDPLSGLLEAGVEELIDCTALAFQLDDALATLPGRAAFSPKLSFIIDGGGPSHIAGLPHDFAFIARPNSDETITFDMTIKGRPACLSLPQEHLITGITAMLTGLAADHQDASQPIRIKSLITEIGHEALLKRIAASLAAANVSDSALVTQDNNTPVSRPAALNPLIGHIAQANPGHHALNLALPNGRLQHFQLAGLAEVAHRFAGSELRLTPWQAIILTNITEEAIADVWQRAEALGLLTQPGEQNLCIISCAGSTGCIHGGFETKHKALAIREALGEMTTPGPLTIHLSACEKGCATRRVTDYLLLQRRGSPDITLHSRAAPSTTRLGKKVAEDDILREIKKII